MAPAPATGEAAETAALERERDARDEARDDACDDACDARDAAGVEPPGRSGVASGMVPAAPSPAALEVVSRERELEPREGEPRAGGGAT